MAIQPGWFERQSKSVAAEVARWPAWMRRAAGLGEATMQWSYHDALAKQDAAGMVTPDMVRLARDLIGMSRTELARAAKLSSRRIKEIESTPCRCSREEVEALAEALQRPPGFFFWQDEVFLPVSCPKLQGMIDEARKRP